VEGVASFMAKRNPEFPAFRSPTVI
jgi:hypothetical protein